MKLFVLSREAYTSESTWKGSHTNKLKIFELCEAKSGYVFNLDKHAGAHTPQNQTITASSVWWTNSVDQLKIMDTWYI
jgi:hypothetical protein